MKSVYKQKGDDRLPQSAVFQSPITSKILIAVPMSIKRHLHLVMHLSHLSKIFRILQAPGSNYPLNLPFFEFFSLLNLGFNGLRHGHIPIIDHLNLFLRRLQTIKVNTSLTFYYISEAGTTRFRFEYLSFHW